jgi:hypothetical protein
VQRGLVQEPLVECGRHGGCQAAALRSALWVFTIQL